MTNHPASGDGPWTVDDSRELYQLDSWSKDYFAIDPSGRIQVQPDGPEGQKIDLPGLVDDLKMRGYELPMLLRFSDILRHRVRTLCGAFQTAIDEYGYRAAYLPVYPIKVNQQRDVVEELVEFGRGHQLGLEAGSKPELLITLAHMDNPEALVICNGYKDRGYIETALLSQKLGRNTIIVVDRFEELDLVLEASRRLGIRPSLGVRSKLNARGAGRWFESGGKGSKFGLTAHELVRVIERLRREDCLDTLQLLHFHIGSQISSIQAIKGALREASRVYVELHGLGAPLKYLDVGGGLGVDYSGTKSNPLSTINYTVQEYANDVVWAIQEACDERGVPHPDIVSESGRALTAHHAVLVFDLIGRSTEHVEQPTEAAAEHEAAPLRSLYEVLNNLDDSNFTESFHDAQILREEALSLFNLGYLDLKGRALAESMHTLICRRIQSICDGLEEVPDELTDLELGLAPTLFCNFSVFQSLPDHWAVGQLFPVLPIQDLDREPKMRSLLADLTCDSDGKVGSFIGKDDAKSTIELHHGAVRRPNYYMAGFLVGAYQETLGDLHNLFGDTHAIHITLDETHGYDIARVVEGDSVTEVLSYVQYGRQELVQRIRRSAEAAVRRGTLRMEESALLLRRFNEALSGYTYLIDGTPAEVAQSPRAGTSDSQQAETAR